MKKSLFLVILLLLSGCTRTSEGEKLRILVPSGAPAVALAGVMDDYEVDVVSGADNLSAELVKSSSDYDIVVVPINLGAKLISEEQTSFRLDSVLTWGNLYILGRPESSNSKVALFGELAVPGKIISVIQDEVDLLREAEVMWLPSVVESQAALLSGEVDLALVAEPVASTLLAKDSSLEVLVDVQLEYEKVTGTANYPQASLFVDSDVNPKDVEALRKLISSSLSSVDDLVVAIDSVGAENLGISSSDQIKLAFDKMNLNLVKASDVSTEISEYLKLFNIDYADDFLFQ